MRRDIRTKQLGENINDLLMFDRWRWCHEQLAANELVPLLAYALARAGRRDEATEILTELLAGRANSHSGSAIAIVFAGLGDYDQAFAWLDKSSDQQLTHYIMGPMFSDLHRDVRFARVKKRIGL